jgi:hypothetical protein
MNSLLARTFLVGCLVAVVSIAYAAEEKKPARKGGGGKTAGVLKKLEGAGLPADVLEKVKKVVEEHAPKVAEAQAKLNSILTDEQKKARDEAQKAAKAAGKDRKAAQADVEAALKLTDEQKKGLEEAQRAAQTAQTDFNKAISALLTDEQKEKAGLAQKRKEKKTE